MVIPTMPLRHSNSVLYGLIVNVPITDERIITNKMDRVKSLYLLSETEKILVTIAKIKKTNNANRIVIPQDKSIECTSKRHRATHSPMT